MLLLDVFAGLAAVSGVKSRCLHHRWAVAWWCCRWCGSPVWGWWFCCSGPPEQQSELNTPQQVSLHPHSHVAFLCLASPPPPDRFLKPKPIKNVWVCLQVRSYPRLLSGSHHHFGAGVFPPQLRDESPFQRGGGELHTFAASQLRSSSPDTTTDSVLTLMDERRLQQPWHLHTSNSWTVI